MSKSDIWFFGFITFWIMLTAGKPDLLDAIICNVGYNNSDICMESKK